MNNKVAVITRHAVPNYGSFFQAFATEKLLSQLGYDGEIIDYRRLDETTKYLIRYYCKRSPGMFRWFYYNVLWRVSDYFRGRVFLKAHKKYLKLSNQCDKKTICKFCDKYDSFLTGSDQVWNTVGSGVSTEVDGCYFWDFLDQGKHIISYAASFGDNRILNNDRAKIKALLSKFSAISIREDSGVALANKLGFSAVQVLDPTMMINSTVWISIANSVEKRNFKPYLLVYNLHSSTDITEVTKKYSRALNLRIVNIISTFRLLPGKNVFCPSVERFLSLFINADFIIADSFHAIAFAIIFRVPFCVKLPENYSTRLESILRKFNLTNRIISGNDIKIIRDDIDWDDVYTILEEEKEKSLEWLKAALPKT